MGKTRDVRIQPPMVLRVLIIEDSEEDALLMVRELKRGGREVFWQRVESEDAYKNALDSQKWDAILADYNLPVYDALMALAVLKDTDRDIPFLIVTGAISNELAVEIMKAGAVDYIMKDRIIRLGPAVEREVRDARIRSEMRSRASALEATYRAVFETSGAAIALVEEDGKLTLVNKQFARLVGYEREEIQGRMNWRDLVTTEEEKAILEIYSMTVPLFRERAYDTVILDRCGVAHNVIITVAPLPDGKGNVASLLDVTAGVKVRQIETALQETESMFKTFMDNVGIGIAVFSPEKQVLSVNRQYAGWNPTFDFASPLFCYDLCTVGSDETACRDCPLEIALSGNSANGQFWHLGNNNQKRYFRIKAAPVSNIEGRVIAVIEMREDITAQILVQDELRKLSAAVEQSPSPVIITDTAGHIEYVNPKFMQVTGYSLEEVIGRTPALLKSGELGKEVYEELWRTVSSGGEFQCEFHNKKKDGGLYWALAVISPIRDANNQITHYLGIQQDISERKTMEKQMREKNIQLEDTLKQLRMIQSRLVQQEKLAGIGQLAAGVAHEINNPLGFVCSNFDMLKKYLGRLREATAVYQQFVADSTTLNGEELATAVQSVQCMEKEKKITVLMEDIPDLLAESADGLERVAAIVKSLRLFSRVDTTGDFAMYDLNGGLESTLLVARNEIKYSADVSTELGDLPPIEAVGSEINQVILNILVNAAQAVRKKHKEEKGKISIKTWADHMAAYCSIQDNGGGIGPEHIERIFDPFFTTKDVGQGTGLGLSISYDLIVHKHSGDIAVESQLGEGTTFTLKLPLRQSVQENITSV